MKMSQGKIFFGSMQETAADSWVFKLHALSKHMYISIYTSGTLNL